MAPSDAAIINSDLPAVDLLRGIEIKFDTDAFADMVGGPKDSKEGEATEQSWGVDWTNEEQKAENSDSDGFGDFDEGPSYPADLTKAKSEINTSEPNDQSAPDLLNLDESPSFQDQSQSYIEDQSSS